MTSGSGTWHVHGRRGSAAAILEAALVLAKLPYDRSDADTVFITLPDGTVMTESAAIILYIDGLVPELGLVPPVRDPLRRDHLRWLMFLVAAVTPTYAADDEGTAEHRKSLWRLVEGAVRGPWFLGDTPSALDLYVGVMTRWEPGRAWFAEHCPRLHDIALTIDRDPRLQQLWQAHAR